MRKLERFFIPVFVFLIIVFFVLYLKDVDFGILANVDINWGLLIVASVISLSFRYWGVVVWRLILKDLGATHMPAFSVLSDVYAKAWMGRYIPGTVTWIAGKIYMASKLGISKSRLAVSSILEGGMQVVASLSVSLFILGLDPRLDIISSEVKIAMIFLAVASLVLLLPPVLNQIVKKSYSLIRRRKAFGELETNMKATVRSYFLYALGAILTGSAYFFLTASFYPSISYDLYWYIVGAFTLAGALGMATPFVPSGLGVRDGVQLVLLSVIMPKEIALLITIFSRLWSAVVDIVFYIMASVLKYRHRESI